MGVRAPSDLAVAGRGGKGRGGEGRGGEGRGNLFARKKYTMPEFLSFVFGIQKHLYCVKRKNVYNSHA